MIRKTILAGLLATVALAASPVESATVKYYSRQRLGAVSSAPAYTYTGAYGSYGTCSGTSQSAPITSCTRNDGIVVANTFCAAAKSQSCTPTTTSCGAMTAGSWISAVGGVKLRATSDPVQAVTLCNAYLASNQTTNPGLCFVTTNSANGYFGNAYWQVSGAIRNNTGAGFYAVACKVGG